MTRAPSPGDPSRQGLIRSATAIVARGGVAALDLATLAEQPGFDRVQLDRTFGGVRGLLLATAAELAAAPGISPPPADARPSSIAAGVADLVRAFRTYVDADPTRFAALLQFTSAAIFGDREFLAPLAEHNRRTRAFVRARLGELHRAGLLGVATANLGAIAELFADGCRGIEMCHLIDRDDALRASAYEALEATLASRLENRASSGPGTTPPAHPVFDPDYRLSMVLEPNGVVRDLLTVEGVHGWNARDYLGRPVGAAAADGPRGAGQAHVWQERLAAACTQPGLTRFHDRRPDADPTGPETVTSTLTPIRSATGEVESILVDIEDRSGTLKAQEAAGWQQEQLRNAIELTQLGTYILYFREPRIIANERFGEIYGRDPQVLMDTGGVDAFLRFIHAEDRAGVRAALDAAMTGEVDYIANFRFWKDTPDGQELRWVSGVGRVESDDEGPARVLGVISDVTDRHKQQEAMLLAQKRQAIGTLAAGVAHDFNNVLGAILGNATAAERRLAAGEPAGESIREITRGARRAGDLVERLLSFSRDDHTPREPYSVATIVREACALIRPTLGMGVELQESYTPGLPDAIGDATGLHQVILNLVVNADYAIGDGPGTIEVTVDSARLGAAPAGTEQALPAGEYLRIRVRDDGSGIAAEIADHAFDPFFTTKPSGVGAGLGLAAAQAVVHDHGGTIALESEPGIGTLFTIHLPADSVVARWFDVGGLPRRDPSTPLRRPRILLLDDEHALTDLADREMAAAGCSVVTSNDPREAIDLLRSDPNGFDAVVTDLAMAQMNGLSVVRYVRALRPTIPVVLTSGFISEETREEANRLGVERVLAKPWTVVELAEAVLDLVGDANQSVATDG